MEVFEQKKYKIDADSFVKWIHEMIKQENRMIKQYLATKEYELAYGCKEAIYTYEFILERIEERDEDWFECD